LRSRAAVLRYVRPVTVQHNDLVPHSQGVLLKAEGDFTHVRKRREDLRSDGGPTSLLKSWLI
jgi:hypothetical protein